MSDLADQAQAHEEQERAMVIERHVNRKRDEPVPNAQGRVCVDCGERIPAKRLAAHPNANRCIEDARRNEQRLKHFAQPGVRDRTVLGGLKKRL